MIDERADIMNVRRWAVVGVLRPSAAPVPAKIERHHMSICDELRSDVIPPMRMRAAAVQQNESSQLRIAAPIEVVEFDALVIEEGVGRLHRDGSRGFVWHSRGILAGY